MPPRRASRTLAVLLTLAAVLTAGAPALIRVRSGDTLWELARQHHTSVAALRALNHLPGNGLIYAGQLLKLPAGGSGAPAGYRIVERGYTVRAGDNLSTIARRYGVSVRTLEVRNRLPSSGLVLIGRRLAIPVRVRTASAVTVNAGFRIPAGVQHSAAAHLAYLRSHRQPSQASARAMVHRTAQRLGVDPSLALAVAYNESGFQQWVVSPVDAVGIMQVLPSTGRVLGSQYGRSLNLLDASDNVLAGVLLLRELVRSTGRADLALAGYYQGLGSIQAQGMLPQTRTYIRNVTALRARFRRG